MMNSLLAFSSITNCAKAASSRSAFGSAARQSRRVALSRRLYSTETAEPSTAGAEKKVETDKKEDASAESQRLSELETKLQEKEAEVKDLTSRLRYLQADFINLQRNSAREKEQTRDFAITRFASDLLETADVLALALKSIPQSALSASDPSTTTDNTQTSTPSSPPTKTSSQYLAELHNGVELTQRQLQQTLFKYHVKPFDPLGDVFDPNRHEALYQAPVPGKEPGTVIDVQKTGYMIKERVLRAAQVGVAQEVPS